MGEIAVEAELENPLDLVAECRNRMLVPRLESADYLLLNLK